MNLRALTTKIWSAVTRHRFGRFGDLSPKQGRVQRREKHFHARASSTATSRLRKSGENSPHLRRQPRCVHLYYYLEKFCFPPRIFAAKERKEHKEKTFYLCALWVLLWLSSLVAASAALGSRAYSRLRKAVRKARVATAAKWASHTFPPARGLQAASASERA